jgi:hypothetical protein
MWCMCMSNKAWWTIHVYGSHILPINGFLLYPWLLTSISSTCDISFENIALKRRVDSKQMPPSILLSDICNDPDAMIRANIQNMVTSH